MIPAVVAPSWRRLLIEAGAALADAQAARWLVEEVAGRRLEALVGELDMPAPPGVAAALDALVARRLAGQPLQHVIGHWPFGGVELRVDRRALVPRPETEVLLAEAFAELDADSAHRPALVVDLGTGTGALACALVHGRSWVRVLAVERDSDAFSLAAENVAALPPAEAERVALLAGSWYTPLADEARGRVRLVVANPPYLAAGEWPSLDPVVRDHDPYDALVAGESGLEAVAAVIAGAPEVLGRPGALLVEVAPHQASAGAALARAAGARQVEIVADLTGRSRVVRARW